MPVKYDVVALGNAIMDVIAQVDDDFLVRHDIPKARTNLIDPERCDYLYNALPASRIETPKTFYDYEAKYLRNDTKYHCPAGLSAPAEAHMASLALAAFDAVGASGWGRVDFMSDPTGRPLMLELNTVPGMTDHSLVPMAARAAGIDFEELCWQVLETSMARVPLPVGGPT